MSEPLLVRAEDERTAGVGRLPIAGSVTDLPAALWLDEPLAPGDARYVDLSSGRGTQVGAFLETHFLAQPRHRPAHAVFLSHRGAGKSTEIQAVLGKLTHRYLPVYFRADDFLDHRSATAEELLLVIAQAVDQVLRDVGLPLPNPLLERIHRWFSERIVTDSTKRVSTFSLEGEARLGAEFPLLARLLATLRSLLRFEGEVREELRSRLRQYPGALLEAVNQLLDAANQSLEPTGREVLIAVDNLDRFDLPAARQIVSDRDLLSGARCKLLLTPPIALDCAPDVNLKGRYFRLLMPSIRLRERHEPYATLSGPGPELLLEVLRRRMDLDRLLPDPEARRRLLLASGGVLRELFQILLEASYEPGAGIISPDAVRRAVARQKRDQRNIIVMQDWWATLRSIRDTKQLPGGEGSLSLLYRHLAFYYDDDGWYDIHPLLAEQPELALGPDRVSLPPSYA